MWSEMKTQHSMTKLVYLDYGNARLLETLMECI